MRRKKSCCGGCAKGAGCDDKKAQLPSLDEAAYLIDAASTPTNSGALDSLGQDSATEASLENNQTRIGGAMADYIAIASAVAGIPESEAPNQQNGNTYPPSPKGSFGLETMDDSPQVLENYLENMFSSRKCGMVAPAQLVQAKPVVDQQAERLYSEGRFFD
jgi:hypothetical protein